jgi:hypothetical protein
VFPQYCLIISTGGHVEDGMNSSRDEEVREEKWGAYTFY